MKAFVLKKIAEKLKNYKFIKRAFRVDENLILMQFDEDKFYFDLTKGNSDIYINIDYPLVKKFKAPFDIVIEKKLTKSKVLDIRAFERILIITSENNNNFKKETVQIRFEFTGRYTNAIILKDNIVIEALRHINENLSSRVVKPGARLKELSKIEIKEKKFEIDNLEEYSKDLFNKKYKVRLDQKKKTAINRIDKKIKVITYKLNKLESTDQLFQKAKLYKKYADILMANLYQIKPYQKEFKTTDFEGKEITIPVPGLKNIKKIGNYYYKLAKKAKKKVENLHIEKSHLSAQLDFLKNYKKLIENAKDLSSLKTYQPNKKEKKEDENIAKFMFDDYLILVGKNEKGNIKLLKKSNANDLWFHIKNLPGAHVILKSNKLKIPSEVIKEAAKLSVTFSGKNEGDVDYTKRKFVKIKEGAKVEYGKYNTLKIKI